MQGYDVLEQEEKIESSKYILPKILTVNVASKWSTKFRNFFQLLSSTNDLTQYISTVNNITDLYNDFVRVAKMHAKNIILEKWNTDKLYHKSDKGGIAGGSKIIRDGIFMKFQNESEAVRLYGGIFNSYKSASLELRNANFLTSILETNFEFPIIVVIDYFGYRVLCSTDLGVSNDTLVMGSSDADILLILKGTTVKHIDDHILEVFGLKMNLESHVVTHDGKSIRFAIDVEVHKIPENNINKNENDSSCYTFVDLARFFPPLYDIKEPRSIYYSQFRPEFVLNYFGSTLCSDAYHGAFLKHDLSREYINMNVTKAQTYLEKDFIPKFCQVILKLFKDRNYTSETAREGFAFSLSQRFLFLNMMHNYGINYKYLGLIYHYFENESPLLKKLVLSEMVSRTSKHVLKAMMKNRLDIFKSSAEIELKNVSIDYLNLLLGISNASTLYWNDELYHSVKNAFCSNSINIDINIPPLDSVVDKVLVLRNLRSFFELKFADFNFVLEVFLKQKNTNIAYPFNDFKFDVVEATKKMGIFDNYSILFSYYGGWLKGVNQRNDLLELIIDTEAHLRPQFLDTYICEWEVYILLSMIKMIIEVKSSFQIINPYATLSLDLAVTRELFKVIYLPWGLDTVMYRLYLRFANCKKAFDIAEKKFPGFLIDTLYSTIFGTIHVLDRSTGIVFLQLLSRFYLFNNNQNGLRDVSNFYSSLLLYLTPTITDRFIYDTILKYQFDIFYERYWHIARCFKEGILDGNSILLNALPLNICQLIISRLISNASLLIDIFHNVASTMFGEKYNKIPNSLVRGRLPYSLHQLSHSIKGKGLTCDACSSLIDEYDYYFTCGNGKCTKVGVYQRPCGLSICSNCLKSGYLEMKAYNHWWTVPQKNSRMLFYSHITSY